MIILNYKFLEINTEKLNSGYGYTSIAKYLEVKPATVKDWFNGRARKKEREYFNNLTEKEKGLLAGRVKTAELSGKPKLVSSI